MKVLKLPIKKKRDEKEERLANLEAYLKNYLIDLTKMRNDLTVMLKEMQRHTAKSKLKLITNEGASNSKKTD